MASDDTVTSGGYASFQTDDSHVNLTETSTLENDLNSAVMGITFYLARPRTGEKSHLSSSAQLFQPEKGKHRAQRYLQALTDESMSAYGKALYLYALVSSDKGEQLKKDVVMELEGACTETAINAAKAAMKEHLLSEYAKLKELTVEAIKQNKSHCDEINQQLRQIIECVDSGAKGLTTINDQERYILPAIAGSYLIK
jgi:hypothetical protein